MAHFIEHMLAGGSDEHSKRSRKVKITEAHDYHTDREQVLGAMDVTAEKLPEAAAMPSSCSLAKSLTRKSSRLNEK